MRKNKKLLLGLAVVLAVVMTLSGTFAWFTATDSVTNHLETSQISDGSVSILEVFTPPKDWKPGQTVTKQVAVVNTGESDVLVRVSFEEMMSLINMPVVGYTSPASGTQIAQKVNATAYQAAPWTNLTGFTTVVGLPSDVTVKMKKVVADAGTSKEKTAYSFVAYHELADGTYQRVTASFDVSGTTLTVSNVKYWAYSGKTETEAAWAKFVKPQTSAVPTIQDIADIDYPITDPNNKITLDYTDKASIISATPVAGKWWYNEADGFFYYIGKLESGKVTPNLLDSLTLDSSAGEAYSGMNFDLIVNMEAIQNTEDAIRAANGWGLEGNNTLINALKAYCV